MVIYARNIGSGQVDNYILPANEISRYWGHSSCVNLLLHPLFNQFYSLFCACSPTNLWAILKSLVEVRRKTTTEPIDVDILRNIFQDEDITLRYLEHPSFLTNLGKISASRHRYKWKEAIYIAAYTAKLSMEEKPQLSFDSDLRNQIPRYKREIFCRGGSIVQYIDYEYFEIIFLYHYEKCGNPVFESILRAIFDVQRDRVSD